MLHRIQPVAIGAGAVENPAPGADEQGVHILGKRVAHVVFAIAESPARRLPRGVRAIKSAIGEGLARFTHIVLAVGIRIHPVEAPISCRVRHTRHADVLPRLLVCESVGRERPARVGHRERQIRIEVKLGIARLPDVGNFRNVVTFVRPVVGVRRLDGYVDQVRKPEILHLPRIVPVARVVPLSVESILRPAQVEILWHEPRINVDRGARVVARDVERVVIHDIVEIHAQPQPMRRLQHQLQIRLRAIARPHASPLIFAAQIEAVPHIVSHRQPARALRRRRHPQRVVARLCHLRQPRRDFPPVAVEILQHRLTSGRDGCEQQGEQSTPESGFYKHTGKRPRAG